MPIPVAWGFPKWDGGVLINARSESALEKSMFAKPLLTRRCVIPSTGFYEWTAASVFEEQLSLFPETDRKSSKEPKVKLLFRQPGETMLYMAGMISAFQDGDAFIILTTEANNSMRPFHDRMPVILGVDEREGWLESEAFMREVLRRECAELEWQRAT